MGTRLIGYESDFKMKIFIFSEIKLILRQLENSLIRISKGDVKVAKTSFIFYPEIRN